MCIGLEGFIHGVAHVMIGGDMGRMESPNDPIFYMHHANVDRLWHVWQKLENTNEDTYLGWDPAHNKDSDLDDVMDMGYASKYASNVKVADLIHIEQLGYSYSAGPTPVYDTPTAAPTAAATPAPTSAPTKAASAGKYGGGSTGSSPKSKSKSASAGSKYGGNSKSKSKSGSKSK